MFVNTISLISYVATYCHLYNRIYLAVHYKAHACWAILKITKIDNLENQQLLFGTPCRIVYCMSLTKVAAFRKALRVHLFV